MQNSPRRSLTYALVLAGCIAIAFLCLAYPIYVIRPFRYQGVRELAAALTILRFQPVTMAICTAICFIATVLYWRAQPRIARRIAACLGLAVMCAITALARVNIYELMFHPMDRPAFMAAGETKLDGDEKVVAVRIAGSARAYPIRSISYHHVVNDSIGGVPIVATY